MLRLVSNTWIFMKTGKWLLSFNWDLYYFIHFLCGTRAQTVNFFCLFYCLCFGIQGGHFSGIYRKVQLKPLKWVKVAKSNGEGEEERPVEALMVLKYGGVLTHAGRKQVLVFSHIIHKLLITSLCNYTGTLCCPWELLFCVGCLTFTIVLVN